MEKKPKQPRTTKTPPPGKKAPRREERPEAVDTECLVWHVRTLDPEGPYGWRQVSMKALWDEVWKKVRDFETMTWSEVKQTSQHHSIEVDRLSKEARKRLEEIGQSDVDELFSLRLTGKQRLWGIRDRHIFKVLWFDPGHKVCPSMKKHT